MDWGFAPARVIVLSLQRPQGTRQTSHEKMCLLVLGTFSKTREVEPRSLQVETMLEALALFMLRCLRPQLLINRGTILMTQRSGITGCAFSNLLLGAVRRVPKTLGQLVPIGVRTSC